MIFRTDAYDNEIAAASKKYGVPQQLIRSVIGVESSWNPNAASGTGPVGLMQISKALAKDYGYSADDRLDPAKNIEMGARYLKSNLDAFGGNVQKALLGYNQGTGGARQMLAGKVPMAEEGRKYMNNPQFAGIIKSSPYLKPSAEGGVDYSADYLTNNSAAYQNPKQAGQAADKYGLGATGAVLNMAEAGMNNEQSTQGASKFTPAMLTKQGAVSAGAEPNAAAAPASTNALGTTSKAPAETPGIDKWDVMTKGLALLNGILNKPQQEQRYAPAPEIRRGAAFRPIESNASRLIGQTFQQQYFNPTYGNGGKR